jgi:DNA-binding MarR family transcriptional regulator
MIVDRKASSSRPSLDEGLATVNALRRLVDELDPMLHERGRLAIVSVLAANDSIIFTELRDDLGMTDGNLSVHLQKLEEKGYVTTTKQFVGRRPQTTCRLTKMGRQAFTKYLEHLQAIVEQGRGQKPA